ncbi:MAG: hypothetical protein ABI898_10865 [Sphingomonadales bacterium]
MTEAKITSTEDRPATHPDQTAMQDEGIVRRLKDNPEDPDAKLDAGLDQSMDASDPPATIQPGDHGEPVPSSGYDEAAEEELRTS